MFIFKYRHPFEKKKYYYFANFTSFFEEGEIDYILTKAMRVQITPDMHRDEIDNTLFRVARYAIHEKIDKTLGLKAHTNYTLDTRHMNVEYNSLTDYFRICDLFAISFCNAKEEAKFKLSNMEIFSGMIERTTEASIDLEDFYYTMPQDFAIMRARLYIQRKMGIV